jgi:hypothetical protein
MQTEMSVPPIKKTIAEAIKEKENPGFPFKPNQENYKALGINPKGLVYILKGKVRPYGDEITVMRNILTL